MSIVDKAWEIIQNSAPSLTLKSFLEKLRPIVEEYKDLSLEEIKIKVLEYIKDEQPFGADLAEGAKYALGESAMSPEAEAEAEKIFQQQLAEEDLEEEVLNLQDETSPSEDEQETERYELESWKQ